MGPKSITYSDVQIPLLNTDKRAALKKMRQDGLSNDLSPKKKIVLYEPLIQSNF